MFTFGRNKRFAALVTQTAFCLPSRESSLKNLAKKKKQKTKKKKRKQKPELPHSIQVPLPFFRLPLREQTRWIFQQAANRQNYRPMKNSPTRHFRLPPSFKNRPRWKTVISIPHDREGSASLPLVRVYKEIHFNWNLNRRRREHHRTKAGPGEALNTEGGGGRFQLFIG